MERRDAMKFGRASNNVSWRAVVLATMLLSLAVILFRPGPASAQYLVPIGQIQGTGNASGYVDQWVGFRGIVTGILEDENSSGTRFYTVFVQDVPGGQDGDPLTSDGIALFVGARRPSLAQGDIAIFGGVVTEFYGLTELDNNGLTFTIESRNNLLPEPVIIDPPADNDDSAAYLERFEGMRVTVPVGRVVGPSHPGCGFSVVRDDAGVQRVLVRSTRDPVGQIVGALHPSDVICQEMPAVGTGDVIEGLEGPLTYHFDRFKIVYQEPFEFEITPLARTQPVSLPKVDVDHVTIATFNVNNYFDSVDDTGTDTEPKPSAAAVSLKQAKIAATITEVLNCPQLIGMQEVENETLLIELVERTAGRCGFTYEISHLESPDLRSAEVALLSDPNRIRIAAVKARQACTELETDVIDPAASCPEGQYPLHSRPPLEVELFADDRRMAILVNHFKSKREGEEETAAWRLAQAEHINLLVQELQSSQGINNVIVMGDFNDYDGSAVMDAVLGRNDLVDALASVPPDERYSYIFDGASQLIDWILITPELEGRVTQAGIVHNSADYPDQLGESADKGNLAFRASDHDVPFIVLRTSAEATPTPSLTPLAPTRQPTPTVSVSDEATVTWTELATDEPTATTVAVRPNVETSTPVVMRQAREFAQTTDDGGKEETASAEGPKPSPHVTGLILVAFLGLLLAAAIRQRGRS